MMSKATQNGVTKQDLVDRATLVQVLDALGGNSVPYGGYLQQWAGHDDAVYGTNGSFNILNATASVSDYHITDVIASAKAAGYTNTEIAKALTSAGIKTANGSDWTNVDVKQYNIQFNEGTSKLQKWLDDNYSDLDPYVSVIAKEKGNGYITRIVYTDPKTGKKVYRDVSDSLNKDGKPLSDTKLKDLFDKTLDKELDYALTEYTQRTQEADTNANIAANADAAISLANKVGAALSGNVGTGVKTNNNLSQADIDAITAAMPGTDNLQAWNQSKDTNVFATITKNLQENNPELLERMSLEDLQNLASVVNDSQTNITQRNIKNQTDQTVQNIQKDPALYQAVVNQLRKDSAAGTIAGQRAANTQSVTAEAGTAYDKAASDLYSSLFGGEGGNVANNTYANQMANKTSSLDQYINQQLGNATADAQQGAVDVQNLDTLLTALAEATNVDVSTYKNAVAEGQAAADRNKDNLSTNLQGDLKTALAKEDADLNTILGLFNKGSEYLSNASNGSADVSSAIASLLYGDSRGNVDTSKISPLTSGNQPSAADAVDTLFKGLQANTKGSGYLTVDPGEYKNTELLTNEQYNDIVNNDFIKSLLSDKTIDAYTKAKTLSDIRNEFGLDMLTEEGLSALYKQYNDEATGQANKVFNQAQRAYIAAVTAGDAKATEQLTRLAANAGAAKGNLYAASALAQQYQQQAGLGNTGRQLATDFLNQQNINTANVAQAAKDANAALTKYVNGDPNNSRVPSLYNIQNQWQQTAAGANSAYGKFGSSVMNSTQGLNDWRVSNNINNSDRLTKLANEYTLANATGAANNTTNQGTKDIYTRYAEALAAQANSTKSNLNK